MSGKLPPNLEKQIGRCTGILKRTVPSLRAVYVHGSICLNAYVPGQSDLDLLALCERPLRKFTKRKLADELLTIHGKPCPIEISIVTTRDVRTIPVRCQFHFSQFWEDTYRSRAAKNPLLEEFEDPDLPAYLRLIRERGIVRFGETPSAALPAISDRQFWLSIAEGVENFSFNQYGLFDSNILTLARIVSFAETRRILSKVEAANLAVDLFPQFASVLRMAIEAYPGAGRPNYDLDQLDAYRIFMTKRIKTYDREIR